ncbi:MAG: carbohydrate ABC transporter permease [Methanomassiliicoccales archaeon]|nr:carbohydrate ABC transporter permease [Methanomassiliicoccales archaeon]
MVTRRLQRGFRFLIVQFGLVPFILFASFPFYWMLLTSFKSDIELYNLRTNPFIIIKPTLQHYSYLFAHTNFVRWLLNTFLVCSISTLFSVLISTFAGYALARLRFRGASLAGSLIFFAYLVPPTLLFLPLTRVISSLGLADKLWSLIVTYPSFMIPFSTWMLMAFFRTIPREIEECALIDGCTRLQAIRRIVLPLALPGVVTVTLFSFLQGWQDMIYSAAFITTSVHKTLSVGVTQELIRGDLFYWGSLMGGALIGSLPVILIFVFLLDYYISGLTAGAIKG